MKRILALVLALSLVFALAACKKNNKENETKEPETEIVTNDNGEEVVVPAEEATGVEATEANSEEATAAEAETATNASGKPSSETPAKPTENKKPASGKLDAAGLAAFLNAETAKISKSNKYNVARSCKYTKPIDVGDKTSALNKLIEKLDSNANLDSVVGDFIGIGTSKGSAKQVNANYRIKATALKASDIQMVSASESKYVFKLANASNPQRNNGTAMGRFTNDFLTESEVRTALSKAAGSVLKLNKASVTYSGITVTVNVAGGKITSMSYAYDFSAALDLKAVVFSVHGTGAAHTTGSYTGIAY